jgi:hypothetical protein
MIFSSSLLYDILGWKLFRELARCCRRKQGGNHRSFASVTKLFFHLKIVTLLNVLSSSIVEYNGGLFLTAELLTEIVSWKAASKYLIYQNQHEMSEPGPFPPPPTPSPPLHPSPAPPPPCPVFLTKHGQRIQWK